MQKKAPMALNQLKKRVNQPTKITDTSIKNKDFEIQLYPVNNIQFLLSNGPDMISTELRKGTYWESSLIQILEHFLQNIPHPTFIDIGANLGSITIPIAKKIQAKQGKVISFEAQRGVYYQLCGNIYANNLMNTCTAYNIAIGKTKADVEIPVLDLIKEQNIGSLSIDPSIRSQQNLLSSANHETETVKLMPLDQFNLPKADIIKIDVEGLELDVLQGAKQYIQNSGFPVIFFEVWGDYMKDLISKREALIDHIQHSLGYETILYGELCIAQHPSNKFFNIEIRDQSLSMNRLK